MSWKPEFDREKGHLGQALAKQLEEDIACGALLPGTKLPPQRELADFLQIKLKHNRPGIPDLLRERAAYQYCGAGNICGV